MDQIDQLSLLRKERNSKNPSTESSEGSHKVETLGEIEKRLISDPNVSHQLKVAYASKMEEFCDIVKEQFNHLIQSGENVVKESDVEEIKNKMNKRKRN